jgi:hypothetical protein
MALPIRTPYTSSFTVGFIPVNLAANAYGRFVNRVYKGDLIGVEEISTLAFTTSPLLLEVGTSKQYQHFTGNQTLVQDLTIVLKQDNAIEGNKFVLHFECSNINLAGYVLKIAQSSGSSQTVLKTISQADIYAMRNQDNGIAFEFIFSSNGAWILYQNYDLGVPFETKILTGLTAGVNFDPATKLGVNKGYFGWSVADGSNDTANLSEMFLVGQNPTNPDYVQPGTIGGAEKVVLGITETPAHVHKFKGTTTDQASGVRTGNDNIKADDDLGLWLTNQDFNTTSAGGNNTEGTDGHENRPPYYTVLYIQKLY